MSAPHSNQESFKLTSQHHDGGFRTTKISTQIHRQTIGARLVPNEKRRHVEEVGATGDN
jgi:hypothetical protein